MAENPATWSRAEHIIDDEFNSWWDDRDEIICGWSLPSRIAHKLREAGLLKEEECEKK